MRYSILSVRIKIVYSAIIAPPGQPSIPTIEGSGATWAIISWTAPIMADSPISYYEIIVRAVNGSEILTTGTIGNATNFNVTGLGLFLGMAYELTVVAVSEGGNITARSPESDSVVIGVSRQCMFI